VVDAVWWSKEPTRRIVTERGEVLTTDEHRWLRGDRQSWTRTLHLGPGSVLRSVDIYANGSEHSADHRAGYISGVTRKSDVLWGRAVRLDPVRVEGVESGPITDVVDIQTSTRTFFAAGLATHNCFARQFYVKADHGDRTDFAARILVKENFAQLLRQELARPTWLGESVVLGTATDPYQPAEGRFRLARATLEALLRHANPFSMLTKSPLVLRDVDVLAELAQVASVRVYFSITTVDVDLWRTVEPGTANPYKRLDVLRALRQAGVPAGVLMAPVMPGLTDSVASIEAVARAAHEHGALFFSAAPLRLMPTVKEHYMEFVRDEFPDLLDRYERAYPGVHAPHDYTSALHRRVQKVRSQFRFENDDARDPPASARLKERVHQRQLALPL
jgi:DNA repair photolyase